VALESAEIPTGPHAEAITTLAISDAVIARPFDAVRFIRDQVQVELPPLSVVAMTLRCGQKRTMPPCYAACGRTRSSGSAVVKYSRKRLVMKKG